MRREQLLHTPEGVRDIYNEECQKKNKLQHDLKKVLKLYGYKDIQTPTFEFFNIFNQERGSVKSTQMYKFFDRNNNTLVLRPDMTPSIARSVAKYYENETMPIRLAYMGNTFLNLGGYQGKLNEMTQIGAELMNIDSADADAEIIVMVVDCLLAAGLKEFRVDLGQADFFNGLMEEASLDKETEEEIKTLVENKNSFGLSQLVDEKVKSDEMKAVLLKFNELFGGEETLEMAKTLTKNKKSLAAIERLEKVYDIVKDYGYEQYVTFDFGMLSRYEYYTGLILKAYTYGTGDAIATGGRYDTLLSQFGMDAPAIGFGIIIDQLLMALSRQKIEIPIENNTTLVVFDRPVQAAAIQIATTLRKEGKVVELLKKDRNCPIDRFERYAKGEQMKQMIYVREDKTVKKVDLEIDAVTLVSLDGFQKGM